MIDVPTNEKKFKSRSNSLNSVSTWHPWIHGPPEKHVIEDKEIENQVLETNWKDVL
jgi:hypothetical protein